MIYIYTNIGIRSRITATGIIASTLLTFALIAVYQSIKKVQISQKKEIAAQRELQEDVLRIEKEQTSIMRTQTEMMAQSHSPDISIENTKITNDSVIFNLENRGGGLAMDVVLVIEVTIPIDNPQASSPYSLGEAICPPERIDSNNPKSVGVIRENSNRAFEFPIRLPTQSSENNEKIVDYEESIESLSKSYNMITLSLSIQYSNASGNRQKMNYRRKSVQISSDTKMSDIISS